MNDIQVLGGPPSSATLREFAAQFDRRVESSNTAVLDDSVEISDLAFFLSQLAEMPESRARRIVQIRAEILDGSYETPEKLESAAERLFEEIAA